MTEAVQIKQALQTIWPAQVDVVGPSTVKNIANNAASDTPYDNPILEATGGANFDPHGTAQLLIDAAVFVKISIEIYKLLKNQNNVPPSKEELQRRILADVRTIKLPQDVKQKLPQVIEYLRNIL